MKMITMLLAITLLAVSCNSDKGKVIKVYTDQHISVNYIGNGVQWSAYPHADTENAEWGKLMTDEKWQMVFDRLDYMKPRFIRVMDQANWRYLKGFDKNKEPIIDYNTEEEAALEKLLSYCQKNKITVLLGEWGCPYQVHDVNEGFSGILKGADDPKWIEMIVTHLDYLINKKGFTCIKYFNLVNEPNGFWASTDGRFEEWKGGAKMLANRLRETGLDKYVTIAGPDAVAHCDHPSEKLTGMQWVEETANQLSDDIGALEIHAYFKNHIIRNAEFDSIYSPLVKQAKDIKKPILFGEIGFDKSIPENVERVKNDPYASEDSYLFVYDYSYGIDMGDALIQIMNTGFNGVAAWALDDAMHTCGDLGNKNELKRWGMWNSLGTELCNNPADENLRPWFYTWSLMCRYFPTGSQIVKTDSTGLEGVRLTAGLFGNDLTIAIVNNSAQAQVLSLDVKVSKPVKKFLYTDGERAADEHGFPLPVQTGINLSKSPVVEIPANSFVLLSSLEY